MSENANLQPDAKAENRAFVLILQHPQERREPLATASIAVAALARAKLAPGLSWPNLARALGRRADPRRWAVLYLGSAHPAAFAAEQDLVVVGGRGEPIENPAPLLRGLEGIVLLDGTWSQAKTLWWRNPWLLKLHRIVLNPPRPPTTTSSRSAPNAAGWAEPR